MNVVSAKSLNGTLGKDDFQPFDVLLSEQVDSIINKINQSTEQKIENETTIKKVVADTSHSNPIFWIGRETGASVSVRFPCDGSLYIYGNLSRKTVSVYINDKIQSLGSILNVTKQQKVRECLIYFNKGDTIRVVVNDEAEQAADGYSNFYAYAYVY